MLHYYSLFVKNMKMAAVEQGMSDTGYPTVQYGAVPFQPAKPDSPAPDS